MKRLLSVLMALTMVIGLFACLGVTSLADGEEDTTGAQDMTVIITGDMSDESYNAMTELKTAAEENDQLAYWVSTSIVGGDISRGLIDDYTTAYAARDAETQDLMFGTYIQPDQTNQITNISVGVNTEDGGYELVYAMIFIAVDGETDAELLKTTVGNFVDLYYTENHPSCQCYVFAIGPAEALTTVEEAGNINVFLSSTPVPVDEETAAEDGAEETAIEDGIEENSLQVVDWSAYEDSIAVLTVNAEGVTVPDVQSTEETGLTEETTPLAESDASEEPSDEPTSESTVEPTPEPTPTPTVELSIAGQEETITWVVGSGTDETVPRPYIEAEQRVTAVYLQRGEQEREELTLGEDYILNEEGTTITFTASWLDTLFSAESEEDGIELLSEDDTAALTISYDTVTPLTVTVSATTAYVGEELLTPAAEDYVIDGLAEGDTATVAYNTEGLDMTTAGEKSVPVTVTVTDSEGNDVTANYSIPETTATVVVAENSGVDTQSEEAPVLTVMVNIKTVYVGEELTLTAEDYTVDGLAEGDTATVAYNTEGLDMTIAEAKSVPVTVTVTDSAGNDVTANYSILETTATVIVAENSGVDTQTGETPVLAVIVKNLEATTGDAVPDITNAYTTDTSQLKAGDELTVTTEYKTADGGSTPDMSVAGETTITATAQVTRDGQDVSSEYEIGITDGILTVTAAEATPEPTETPAADYITDTWTRPSDYTYTFDKDVDSFYYSYNGREISFTKDTDYAVSGSTLTLKASGKVGGWDDTGTSYHPFTVKFTDGTTVEFRLKLAGGKVTAAAATATPAPTTEATPVPTAAVSNEERAAATGDTTPVGLIIVIVVVLAVALVVVIVLANKSKKKSGRDDGTDR